MDTNELFLQYEALYQKRSAYQLALNTMNFDAQTIAPRKGANYRNERMAFLSGEYFSLSTGSEMIQLLSKLKDADDLDEVQKAIVFYEWRDLEAIRNIPLDEYVAYQKLQLDSEQAWEIAKTKNDYALFEPWLIQMIHKSRDLLRYRPDYGNKPDYDYLLDDYEIGMTIERYDAFFDLIREELVPLIQKITKAKQIDTSFLNKQYPAQSQAEVMKQIMRYLCFDTEAGLLSESMHPFTSSFSKYDNRITTKYLIDNLASSIFSVIHETGHATYNAQVKDELADTYLFSNMTSGMHESQSRLFENYLGRDEAFWQANYPLLQKAFLLQLQGIDQTQFVKAINASVPSLIRTEADELTYPLHILIRYELEKGLFDGSIPTDHLDQAWADKYEAYLGIRPTNPAEGILQDIHWAEGLFGYFPTYALGSAYGAQFMHAMRKELDVSACLAHKEFYKIKDWLRTHIHESGGMNTPEVQMKIATKEAFNPQYYVDYLKEKYQRLYLL